MRDGDQQPLTARIWERSCAMEFKQPLPATARILERSWRLELSAHKTLNSREEESFVKMATYVVYHSLVITKLAI